MVSSDFDTDGQLNRSGILSMSVAVPNMRAIPEREVFTIFRIIWLADGIAFFDLQILLNLD